MAKEDKGFDIRKTMKIINGWASTSEPLQCIAQYGVWENEKDYGIFTVDRNGKSEEIEGYMLSENKSEVTLTWELPGSVAAAIDTLERDEWKKEWESDGEIEYDELEGPV